MKTVAMATIIALLLMPSFTTGQPPQYHLEFLGEFFPGRLSENGQIIGTTTEGGNQRGYVFVPGQPLQLLPLPEGMNSSNAVDVSEEGLIVGAVSTFYSPEFSGRAIAWDPDGNGGYTTRLLGALPNQSISRATAVNNVGDIVGYSSDGTYRYPVLFTDPDGVIDLTSTGIFDPIDINDQRVLVDRSFTVKRLDLDTMIAEDLGVPPGSYLATSAVSINESSQVGGLAILSSGGNCDRVAARYTDGTGWEILSGCGQYNSVSDMNEAGDVVMRLNVAPYVRFEGLGTFLIEDLIIHDVGHWYVSNLSGQTINSSRQIAAFATNQVTGQSGAVLLTPEGSAGVATPDISSDMPVLRPYGYPNPFSVKTGISYDLPDISKVTLLVVDISGRVVRRLVDEKIQGLGHHTVDWDGRDDARRLLANGVYRLRFEVDGVTSIGSIVLLR